MPVPAIALEAKGEGTVSFSVRLSNGHKVRMAGITDPMTLGVEKLSVLASDPTVINDLFTPDSRINFAIAMGREKDIPALVEAWEHAAGLGENGLSIVSVVIENLDVVEADLQYFYGIELSDWFVGGLSTRRLLVLLRGLLHRPESLFWSEFGEIDPLSKAEILLAQISSQLNEGKSHPFLSAKKDRKDRQEQEEKMARMSQRGLTTHN